MNAHRLSKPFWSAALLLALGFLFSGCQQGPTRHPLLDAERVVFLCQHPLSQATIPTELPQNADAVTVMAPMWYDIRDDGAVTTIDPKADFGPYLAFTQERGLAVMPILRNFKPHTFLLDPSAVDRAVADIVELLDHGGFDGVTIDIEEDGSDTRLKAPMLGFVERVYTETQRRGMLLCVTFNPVYWGRSWQNEEILSRCDWAFAMFYDYSGPWNKSVTNATAPYQWPERSRDIKRDVARIMTPTNAPKILFGIPTYGNRVTLDETGACVDFTVAYVNRLVEEKRKAGATRTWDALARTPRFEYEADGKRRIVWYEDEQSYRWRMALAQEKGAAGVGVWSIGASGGIDDDVWKVMGEYRKGVLKEATAEK